VTLLALLVLESIRMNVTLAMMGTSSLTLRVLKSVLMDSMEILEIILATRVLMNVRLALLMIFVLSASTVPTN